MNRIQSSRRLERETQRNVELIWLTGRLSPDFKTIADFRKDNGNAIRRVCRQFVVLCRSLELFTEALVAIDGSKFKAVNGRDRNFTQHKLKARMQQLEASIARYLTDLDRADRDPSSVTEARVEHLKEKVETVKAQMQRLKDLGEQMAQTPDEQISLTDPDARSMATSARGSGVVGYNVQTAVDAKHHLIVTHEVTNKGTDRSQLSSMGQQPQQALRTQKITALADRGVASRGRSGLNVWIPVPDETVAITRLLSAGWAAAPGTRFRIATPPGIRITVSSIDIDDIGPLADALAEAVHAIGRASV